MGQNVISVTDRSVAFGFRPAGLSISETEILLLTWEFHAE